MENSVLVFHFGRSGSRVLGQLLNQHPSIDWAGEALKRPLVESYKASLDDPASYDTFQHLGSLSSGRAKPWLGVEAKFFHLRQHGLATPDFLDRAEAAGCQRFVVLRRKNSLRKIVSSMVAKQTRSYHRAANEAPKLHQIDINPDLVEIDAESKPLLAYLDDFDTCFAELDRLLADRTTLRLSYEDDICEDPRAACSAICEFLGLDAHQTEVPFGRTNPFPLSDIIRNIDQIRAHLAATPYAWMTE